jgi:signal transduction histidine kinase
VQEALNNTHKHAKAGRADVILDKRRDTIILIVEDDGIGFDPEDKKTHSKGIGLIGMRERVALVGGEIEIESTPKSGTTIYVRVPIANR